MVTTRKGFSLIEVTIVLALSVVMMGVVAGVYSQRRNVASDDAMQQVLSSIQTVRNEATQGLGPTNDAVFASGETLFGEAVEFKNNCISSKSCLKIYKLKLGADLQTVSSYESYDVAVPEGFEFNLIVSTSGVCSTQYISCYSKPTSSLDNLTVDPIRLSLSRPGLILVIRNGSGSMYVFSKDGTGIGLTANTFNNTNYTADRQGVLSIAVAQLEGSSTNQASWESVKTKYKLNIDLGSNKLIEVKRL